MIKSPIMKIHTTYPSPSVMSNSTNAVEGNKKGSENLSETLSITETSRDDPDKKNDTPLSYLDDPALKQMVAELRARDSEVRAHEAAHIAAGGGIVTGGAAFSYQKGPDGQLYAIGGEVPIDASEESSPEATIQKMQQVRAAAMAPSNPSATDYKVAANAMMAEMKARQELAAEEMEQAQAQNGLDLRA